jgi:hypothetical protein
MSNLDARIAELAERYLPLAIEMLAEAVRIPADFVDRPADQGGDPLCGLSNHEFPRIDYLRRKIIEIGAVRRPEDAFFDDFGNLVWWVEDPDDGIAPELKKVIYIDGHTDTVRALRSGWRERVGGVDCYDGLLDASQVNREFLRRSWAGSLRRPSGSTCSSAGARRTSSAAWWPRPSPPRSSWSWPAKAR